MFDWLELSTPKRAICHSQEGDQRYGTLGWEMVMNVSQFQKLPAAL